MPCATCAAETTPGPVCSRCAALAQLTQPVLRLETRRRPPVPSTPAHGRESGGGDCSQPRSAGGRWVRIDAA